MTTAVQDRAFPGSGDDGLTELKKFLRMDPSDTSDDTILGLAIEAAKESADNYLGNAFEGSDGNDQAIPAQVELGVLVFAATEAVRIEPEIASKSGRDLQEQRRTPEDAKRSVENRHWFEYRKIPGDYDD